MDRKIFAGIFIIIVIALSIFAYSSSLTGRIANANEKVKIGVIQHAAGLPYLVAIEKGYFEQEGISAEYIPFASGKTVGDALTTGQIDMGLMSYTQLFAIESRTPGTFKGALMVGDTLEQGTIPLLVPINSTITNISQLTGKKVGIASATVLPTVKIILSKFFDINQTQIETIDTSLQVEALAGGQLDALFATEPQATIAIEAGIARVLETSPRAKYIMDPFPAGPAIAFKTEYATAHETNVGKIIAALNRATEYIKTNKTDSRRIMADKLKLKQNVAQKTTLYHYYKQSELTQEVKQKVQELADILHREGQLDKQINTTNLFYAG